MNVQITVDAQPGRFLVVEDDVHLGRLIQFWLKSQPWAEVTLCHTASEAKRLLAERAFDVVLADIQLPDSDGTEVARFARDARPNTHVVLMTAHAGLDVMKSAVECAATKLLPKPLSRAALLDELAQIRQASNTPKSRQVVLAIGAHPDDVEIGCGGTLLEHRRRGDVIFTLTATRGEKAGPAEVRTHEAQAAAQLVGSQLYLGRLVDTAVSEGLETIQTIEQVVQEIAPDVVYTHSQNDWHQDHRAVHAASIVACRRVPNVLCYQSPSCNPSFLPNVYVNIDAHVEAKQELLECFASQAKAPYLRPELVTATAQYWGRFAGYGAVEPFETVRLTSYRMQAAESTAAAPTAQVQRVHASDVAPLSLPGRAVAAA